MHIARRFRFRSAVLLALTMALLLASSTFNSRTARADDGREPDVVGEIGSYYMHFLGRAPDVSGLLHYLDIVEVNCVEGLYHAARSVANSAEAHAFLDTNDRKANALYASFLNRFPDSAGWQRHKAALDRGEPWSQIVYNVLESPEFINRALQLCPAPTPVNCEIVNQGPPSASLPPESQDWFRCQPAGQTGRQWSDQCVEAIKETAVGVVTEEIGKAEASRYQLGKLALKKFGFVGWLSNGNDVIVIIRNCP